jgi:hypothetical protein
VICAAGSCLGIDRSPSAVRSAALDDGLFDSNNLHPITSALILENRYGLRQRSSEVMFCYD